jgi:hypothetical protein
VVALVAAPEKEEEEVVDADADGNGARFGTSAGNWVAGLRARPVRIVKFKALPVGRDESKKRT